MSTYGSSLQALVVFLILCFTSTGYANNGEYEFVFSIPEVYTLSDNPHVMISTASSNPVIATVTIPGTEFEVNKIVTHDSYTDITLPGTVYHRDNGTEDAKTVVVRANAEVSVHVMTNSRAGPGDGFLVLPTKQLGRNHYVIGYTPYRFNINEYSSFISISALKDQTTVELKTNVGKIVTITLKPYQSYQFVGKPGKDLTGSRVTSDNPVTVVAGSRCSHVGHAANGDCDPLVEQMPPMRMWGNSAVISPFTMTTNGYIYRVMGTNVTTTVAVSNAGNITLAEGQWYEGDVTNDTIVTIEADFPILVMQYVKGGGSSFSRSDPSMVLVPTNNMYIRRITFPVFEVTVHTNQYFIHVITRCENVAGLKYDNSSMLRFEILTSSGGEMCSVRGEVTAGAVHTVSHHDTNVTFTVVVYGSGFRHTESYAYSAGIRVFDIEDIRDGVPDNTASADVDNGKAQEDKECTNLPETEETKCLSTSELQRLVLLEKLKLIRMQQKHINETDITKLNIY